jgi:pSer/pThr/pTyr-binding forkhead associated (FHA) protein
VDDRLWGVHALCKGPHRLTGKIGLSVGRDDTLEIEDMRSTNGTYVDGVAVKSGAPHALKPGAKLRIGDIELVVRYD